MSTPLRSYASPQRPDVVRRRLKDPNCNGLGRLAALDALKGRTRKGSDFDMSVSEAASLLQQAESTPKRHKA